MILQDFYNSEPQKYWTPPKSKHIEADIITNPSKYQDYIGMYKMDGNWSRVIIDNENNVTIQSRTISKTTGTYSEKTEHLPLLVELFKSLNIPGSVLLGEICYWDLSKTATDVGKILRCLPAKALARQAGCPLCFYGFDCLMYSNRDLCDKHFTERYAYLYEISRRIHSEYYCVAPLLTIDEVVEQYDSYLSKGGEGFLLMRKDATYNPGSRTAWKSIKLKKATEILFLPVVDTIDPVKEYQGTSLETWSYWLNDEAVTKPYYYGWKNGLVVNNGGVEIKVASGLSDKDREYFATEEFQKQMKEGRIWAHISGMEVTKDNSIRHPIFIDVVIVDEEK